MAAATAPAVLEAAVLEATATATAVTIAATAVDCYVIAM